MGWKNGWTRCGPTDPDFQTSMRIALICPGYPSDTSHSFAFIHVRAKLYQKFGHHAEVFVPADTSFDHNWERIDVHRVQSREFVYRVRKYCPDVLAIYYPTYSLVQLVDKLSFPKVVWILGHEMLLSFRLTSSASLLTWLKKRAFLIPRLVHQISMIRKFLKRMDHYIFVSNWLHRASERHSLGEFENAVIIPNPVDTELFFYLEPEDLTKGISLRSWERTVYGLDVAIRAFSQSPQAQLTLVGQGRFHKQFEKLIAKLGSNTILRNECIAHNQLPMLYHQYGFFVAPSRRETQGLSMCEAMACGLPVVASNVGGIPEFVRDGLDGYLVEPNNPSALMQAVVRLVTNRTEFLRKSIRAREFIKSRCDSNLVITQELEVLKTALNSSALVGE
jgi:glycosyltransferase involved in cell wall biosynthesis